ncbi:TetR family transcriptional regulator [Neosynechococcus sphagnicola sy1]|uniref:TetR family transcriptional regulator n=1 Tax=Neosynechococcus sphagnicola sy1 TaxID=1497020 RepID=A0A098TLN6_9CYAN|nr:TetR/AcrR family transcriptional regulator [Neosynechococcus sphagnicola]KGF71758.1 TetR family transcriptional regulator [Neosynechococcus sphagnicola sy1]
MTAQRHPTRQRLIQAALELFASQGVTETTTKQIAELADVNEVTLFRHFGNKHGLLLAVIEEAAVFTQLGQTLIQQTSQTSSVYQALKDYATACLQALEAVPEVVRSVVGEAGQYPSENREALGRGFTQANRYVAEYFATVMQRGQLHTHLAAEKLASLLNGMLLGYAVIEFTSEFHELWQDRDDFLEHLVTLFLHGAVSQNSDAGGEPADLDRPKLRAANIAPEKVADLPAHLVHTLLQQSKKLGLQEYAGVYLLFAAGLSSQELIQLERTHLISNTHQQILQITPGAIRQVPVNQWILGKRYGSSTNNPLTRWLKSRKDNQTALFLNEAGQPLSEIELLQQWQAVTEGYLTPAGHAPRIEQAQQTWCVEMLMRGIALEDLCILSGWDAKQLQPYASRAREKIALEQALRLDQKN